MNQIFRRLTQYIHTNSVVDLQNHILSCKERSGYKQWQTSFSHFAFTVLFLAVTTQRNTASQSHNSVLFFVGYHLKFLLNKKNYFQVLRFRQLLLLQFYS